MDRVEIDAHVAQAHRLIAICERVYKGAALKKARSSIMYGLCEAVITLAEMTRASNERGEANTND